MERKIYNPDERIEAVREYTASFVSEIGLSHKVKVDSVKTRNGATQISISSTGTDIRLGNADPGTVEILEGNTEEVIRYISSAIGKPGAPVCSTDLLEQPEFQSSSLRQVTSMSSTPNLVLKQFMRFPDRIPVTYGSTSGINAAEVMETLLCAKESTALGKPSEVIFDFSGTDSPRSRQILAASLDIFADKNNVLSFISSLGQTSQEQMLEAAEIIFNGQPISFIPSEAIFRKMGESFTMGKLLVLARLSGSDPKLFGDMRSKDIFSRQRGIPLSTPICELDNPAGFAFYARGAVLGADFSGSYISPLKLTDKANIYKILSTYGALASQRGGEGVVLCPIQKHRIQTRQQINRQSGDPVDIRVLAYLSQISPDKFEVLANDFRNSCRVLSAGEAIEIGTTDKRFCVEDYFEEVLSI